MPEYFIAAQSFAAPFISESSESFVVADSPKQALEQFAASYRFPYGLYSAVCYTDANAYHKGAEPLAKWICNHELRKQELTANAKGGYSYLGHAPGDFEIDGVRHRIENPKGGKVITENPR